MVRNPTLSIPLASNRRPSSCRGGELVGGIVGHRGYFAVDDFFEHVAGFIIIGVGFQ